MSAHWFYVENNKKVGPIPEDKLIELIKIKKLNQNDFVWTKGFPNWKKLNEVDEFESYFLETEEETFNWKNVKGEDKIFFIMTGKDRNSRETLYGPYSLNILVKLFREQRINGRSYIWSAGMKNWKIIADVEVFETVFSEKPPQIDDIDRRIHIRKPFIARMLFHDDAKLYEGICRDISLGGMQVLVSGYPGVVGDKISFNVHPDNSAYHFVASGEIVRILEGGQGFSFRFTELSSEAKTAISGYVQESH